MRLPFSVGRLIPLSVVLSLTVSTMGCGRSKVSAATVSSAESTLPVAPVVSPQRQTLSNQLHVAGELLPYQKVNLHAKVSGYIRNIRVDIGDRVHTGEDLADLEIPELMAQVDGAKAGVQRAEEDILRAQSAVIRAQANHAALHANYTRLKQAAAVPGLIAEQELDDAQAKDSASAAQVDAAKDNLSAMQQALSVAKDNSSHYSALAGYAHITAPFNGVVTDRYSDTGALVQAGTSSAAAQPVVELEETDVLRLRLPVPEALAGYVHIGDPAKIDVEATGQDLTGKVVRTSGALDLATRTLQVEIDLKNTDNRLLPGMYADVTLSIRHAGTGLTLPEQAVDQTDGQPYALLVNSHGRIERRLLRLGVQTPSRVEVISGLRPSDRVVATNLASFTRGEAVRAQHVSLPTFNGGNGGK